MWYPIWPGTSESKLLIITRGEIGRLVVVVVVLPLRLFGLPSAPNAKSSPWVMIMTPCNASSYLVWGSILFKKSNPNGTFSWFGLKCIHHPYIGMLWVPGTPSAHQRRRLGPILGHTLTTYTFDPFNLNPFNLNPFYLNPWAHGKKRLFLIKNIYKSQSKFLTCPVAEQNGRRASPKKMPSTPNNKSIQSSVHRTHSIRENDTLSEW